MKIYFFAILALWIGTSAPASAQPARQGRAVVYDVSVMRLELCTDSSCSKSLSIESSRGSSIWAIGSASSNSDIGSFGTLPPIPAGTTYTHIRATLYRDFVFQGSVCMAAGVCCATRTGSTNVNDPTYGLGTRTVDEASANAASQPQAMHVGAAIVSGPIPDPDTLLTGLTMPPLYKRGSMVALNNTSFTMIYALSSPYTSRGVAPTFKVRFGTATAVVAWMMGGNCVMLPSVVNVTTIIQ